MRAYLTFSVIGFGLLTACSSHDDSSQKPSPGASANVPVANGGGSAATPATSSLVGIDVKSFCNKATTGCGDTSTKESDCEAMFSAVRVSKDCAAALENASCQDLSSGAGAVTSCFPSCSNPGTTKCNGDGTLSVCGNASKALVYDCAATCSEVGKSWSGNCGSAADQQGQNQQDRCLCK